MRGARGSTPFQLNNHHGMSHKPDSGKDSQSDAEGAMR